MRVAKDADLITQIMGRMVRTPLARRILTDETLNSVHCILPKFDAAAVDAIAARFEEGDADNLTGGTRIIKDPITYKHNPFLTANPAPATPPSPAPATDGGGPSDADLEAWYGGDPEPAADDTAASGQMSTSVSSGTAVAPASTDTPAPSPALGGGADGADLFNQGETQTLTTDAPQDVFGVIRSLPSYTIPRRTLRGPVARLYALATLLAGEHDGHQLLPYAPTQATNELLSVISTRKENLQAAGEWDKMLEQAGQTHLFERNVAFGTKTEKVNETDTKIALDTRGIKMLMDRARSTLPQGLANAYVNKVAPNDDDVIDAMLETIALASDAEIVKEINVRANHLIEQWFLKFDSAITRLSPMDQERFDRIKRESDRPLRTSVTIPDQRDEQAEGDPYDKHLISDENGKFRVSLQKWEKHILETELAHGAVAWYRNPNSGRHALQIPYTTSSGIKGMVPDFVFIHEVGGSLVPSLIDPHGTHLADAVDKLKGLAKYTAQHGDTYQRVQSIALVDGKYLMLNHKNPEVRDSILAFPGTASAELFRQHGTEY
ncbi:hypothetical protein V5H98_11845 [Georgenia sp. M64]|uniref:hypothetical protein n=1 Tax=Georgenia sp. M64 TaxID=3120520 RepID=UPI0030DE8F8D